MKKPSSILSLSNVQYSWPGQQQGLLIPEMTLDRGEHCFIRGPSGSGKSTFLSLLAGLVTPKAGTIELLTQDVTKQSRRHRDRFRADHMGIIFQQFNLVPYLNAIDNVLLPCRFSSLRRDRLAAPAAESARDVLEALDIPRTHWYSKIGELSVGQQQRVAAARALLGAPEIVLADEPTSALDENNRDRFLNLLIRLAEEKGSTVLFVSHDQTLASRFPRNQDITEWMEPAA
ncbi:ABC transporter ATP-binding protein [Marinobacter sp. V034]|uniref:ABC transporter ATP-binding protein n=1 Tax=Marinobacter sp. V034 TaxID=3459610 RepID=UPI004043A9BE